MTVRIPAGVLKDFARRLLIAVGTPERAAEQCAAVLVQADLEGNGSHGIMRLPIYLEAIERSQIDPASQVTIQQTGVAAATVDGGNALGPTVGIIAMGEAIRLARQAGVGIVAARHSNHYGAASYYARLAAEESMIGIAMTNTPPAMPPWGGRDPYLGTNPIAFAFPTPNEPIVIDLSLSVVARGRIIEAAQRGQAIPPGWAVDRAGNETSDPLAALAGSLMPLGGAKGFALALAVEVLSGVLSGAAFGPHVLSILGDDSRPANVGHCFLAIDIGRFRPIAAFTSELGHMAQELTAIPTTDGAEAIRMPGERRAHRREQQLSEGIALHDELVRALNNLASQRGVPPVVAEHMSTCGERRNLSAEEHI